MAIKCGLEFTRNFFLQNGDLTFFTRQSQRNKNRQNQQGNVENKIKIRLDCFERVLTLVTILKTQINLTLNLTFTLKFQTLLKSNFWWIYVPPKRKLKREHPEGTSWHVHPRLRSAFDRLSCQMFLQEVTLKTDQTVQMSCTGDRNSTCPLVKSRNDEYFFPKHLSCRTSALERLTWWSHITPFCSLLHMLLKDKCMFVGRVKL